MLACFSEPAEALARIPWEHTKITHSRLQLMHARSGTAVVVAQLPVLPGVGWLMLTLGSLT